MICHCTLHGAKGAGKNTVGDILVRDYNFIEIAFADRLKDAALALDPLIPVEPFDFDARPHVRLSELIDKHGWREAKDTYPEVRRTLQRLGTEAGWMIHGSDLWVAPVRKFIDEHPDNNIVITDVRFPSEVDMITNLDRTHDLWVVDREITDNADTHSSEQLHTTPDLNARHIDNNETLSDLKDAISHALSD